ncbi:MAG: chloride channel protein [Desulfomonilia bacterium]|jgi:CIC family chloride channel protein|nr:chloride channel protein [Desulfomonilia bacterium]HPW68873.1 chloride channel protein [Deltaproteobacteria bacterium]
MKDIIRRFAGNEYVLMVCMAAVIGVLGGYGAVGFRWLIGFFQGLFFSQQGSNSVLEAVLSLPWYARLIPPIIGGAVVGPMVYFFAREARGHGVPEVMEAVALKGGMIRKRVVAIKTLASSITIGSGGSAGQEGPIVQIGSGIGSALGRMAGVSADRMRTLVACGAAAGIAATFNAPIAGAMFALEIILGDFGIAAFTPIVVSSVLATVISRVHLGAFPAFLVPQYSMVSVWEILTYSSFGIVMGIVGVMFTVTLYKFEDLFDAIRIPPYTKAAIGGAIVGCTGIFLPHIFGVGYDAISLALLGQIPWLLLLSLVVIKILATSVTIGSGGSGGVFAPSLFIGAMTGGAFGFVMQTLFPQVTAAQGAYSLVGMGAMVSATTHGPITAILMLFEMTGGYKMILPLMLSCIISTVVASQLKRDSIYTLKLARRGVDIRAGKDVNVMKALLVRDAMTRDVVTVPADMPLKKLVRFTLSSKHSSFPLVDKDGLLEGIVTFQDFKDVVFEEGLGDLVVAKELSPQEVITITGNENLDSALRKIGVKNIEQIPVVDELNPRKIVGILSRRDIFTAYNKAIIDRSITAGDAAKSDRNKRRSAA